MGVAGIQPSCWCVQHRGGGRGFSCPHGRSQRGGSGEAEPRAPWGEGGWHTSGGSCGHQHQNPQRGVWLFTQGCHWVTLSLFFFLRKYIFKGIYGKKLDLYRRVFVRASLTLVNRWKLFKCPVEE